MESQRRQGDQKSKEALTNLLFNNRFIFQVEPAVLGAWKLLQPPGPEAIPDDRHIFTFLHGNLM